MDCTRYREQVNYFTDGELEPWPQAVIFVYGMSPVEDLGPPAVKMSTDLDRLNH